MRAAIIGAAMFGGLMGCSGSAEKPASLRISKTDVGQVLTAPSKQAPAKVLADFLGRSEAELTVEQAVAGADGITHVRLAQQAGGLRIEGAYARAAVLPNGSLVHVVDALVEGGAVPMHALTDAAALEAALVKHGFSKTSLRQVGATGNVATFEASDELFSAPTVERVAFVDPAGQLQAGFVVETWSAEDNLLHHTLVDGRGQVVKVELRTNNDSYRVFTEDPAKTPQAIVQGPGAGNAESPAGWLGTGSQLTWNIQGNNVNAYLDVDKNNRADRGGTSVTNGNFLAVADLTASPSTTTNRDVAVQNLFFLNNTIHDILYRHGFNEAAGNFQVNNFGKGGSGNDPVQAEAQDGSGTDNANFSTPADGQAPRMQMYLWSGYGATHEVVAGGTTYGAYGAGFGAALTTAGLTGAMALYNDGTGDTADGCEASKASLTGKVALVNRGTCSFTVKVLNAQNAGATGVIVVNNVAGEAFTMGGTDRKVKISSVMVSDVAGAALKAIVGTSATLRKKAVQPNMIDGDLDSDIVFHEYGHGLSWRMIGGMSGPLAGAIGEGASDTVAFFVNGDDLVGEYAYGSGIRRYPYAGYPLTYKDVTGAEVHNDGEIYAAAMWKFRELGLAAGFTNDQLFTLFVHGMNYTPATPKFEDMRDGMIQASTTEFGGAYTCLVWKAFAQFGIGQGAKGTVVSMTSVTVTESFAVPASCP